jgi:hypothetical protein
MLTIIMFSLLLAESSSATNRNPVADFDGDGKTDISVFRRSDGHWYISKSSGGYSFLQWGISTDTPVAGDYDGDGKTDSAVHRSSSFGTFANNTWYILRSSDNSFRARQWGMGGGFIFDAPEPADYDGDQKTDLTFYRNSDVVPVPGSFHILQSSTDLGVISQWGTNADKRVPADYDGDGKADLAVYRFRTFDGSAVNPTWLIQESSTGATRVESFGLPTDITVPADYDGDGKADIAVWRPSNGYWYWISSLNKSFNSYQFGLTDDKPVPGDYDGDGKTDFAVFRPSNGTWYIQQSNKGFRAEQFGLATDIPIPNTFVR